eukprot:m.1049613 g.1049613  ORF g.1049613 m.1049613 type:complete len:350 (+) comp24174_c1_seq14:227-1276(+)
MSNMDIFSSFTSDALQFFDNIERLKASFVGVFGVYACVALAHIILPGSVIDGYACDRHGNTLTYKINGIPVVVLSVLVFHWYAPNKTFFYDNYYHCWFWGNVFGLLGSAVFYYKGRQQPENEIEYGPRSRTKDCPVSSSTPSDKAAFWEQGFFRSFYVGLEFNPRHRFVSTDFDWKMWLYLVGAVMLELVVLSTVAANRRENGGHYSVAAVVGGVMWTWFVFEYIYHEHVHLYTYDIFAERLGFKLIWGCLAWYPFFYSIGLRCLVVPLGETFTDITTTQGCCIVALFLFGWTLTRGANMQKYTACRQLHKQSARAPLLHTCVHPCRRVYVCVSEYVCVWVSVSASACF